MDCLLKNYKTPCYIIHKKKFEDNLNEIWGNFKKYWEKEVICSYSFKTNNSQAMLQLAKQNNMYAEVVSASEYKLAKSIGFQDECIVYNGPCKGEEVYEACHLGAMINIDNLDELEELSVEYFKRYSTFPKKLGLRVNFDLEKYVPEQTSTGTEDGRFGICYENGDFERALEYLKSNQIVLEGIHVHYTTKTRSLEVYQEISKLISRLVATYELKVSYVDIGGGFWGGRKIPGKPTMEEYAEVISDTLANVSCDKLILEPGSALCSTVAEYLCKVVAMKDVRNTRFIILDGTSLHINPFQYERNAQYLMEKSDTKYSESMEKKQIFCGSTCLEKDRFACVERNEDIKKGDIVRFQNVGAYTMSFLSDFIVEKPVIYIED